MAPAEAGRAPPEPRGFEPKPSRAPREAGARGGAGGELKHAGVAVLKAEEGQAGGGGKEDCWPDTCEDLSLVPADVSHLVENAR